MKPLKTSIYQHIAVAVCRCCVQHIRRVYRPPFHEAGFIISSSSAFVNRHHLGNPSAPAALLVPVGRLFVTVPLSSLARTLLPTAVEYGFLYGFQLLF